MVMQDNPNKLDSLIDDVARQMTDAPADEALVRRVSARIQDAHGTPARRTWARPWLLVPAAAVVVLLAVMVVRQLPSANVRPTASAPAVRLTPSAKATGGENPDATPVTKPDAANTTVRLKPDATRVTKLEAAGQPNPDFQPLITQPIEMTALDVAPLVVAMPIEISTIAIERIEIAAMP